MKAITFTAAVVTAILTLALPGLAQKPDFVPTNPNRINQLSELQVAPLKAATKSFRAWLMDTDSKREEGMMFLVDKDFPETRGMLFVFSSVQHVSDGRGFWMKNCPLALDIIYVGPNHRVLNVGWGKPFNETSVTPAGDYQFVLELKRGTAKKFGIKAGSKIEFSDKIRSKD